MPPKGKGKKAKEDAARETEPGTGIDHFEVPKSTIARVAKGSVPDGVKLAKEIPTALVRATTVFISYLAAISQDVAADKSHKTITAAHVLEAVQLLDWDDGKDVSKMLNKELKAYKAGKSKKAKKPAASSSKIPAASEVAAELSAPGSALVGAEALPTESSEQHAELVQLVGDEDDDAESYGEPEEEEIEEEDLSDDEEALEVEVLETEDKGLQDDDAHMAEPEETQ